MKEFIIKEFRKTILKAQEKLSLKNGTVPAAIQIVLALTADGENRYLMYKNYAPAGELDINDVLGTKFDFLGKAALVEPVINKMLHNVSQAEVIASVRVRIMLIRKGETEVVLALYNHDQYVKQLHLEELISEADLIPG
jgi:hypothetical protein